jgi:hypothetical protein
MMIMTMIRECQKPIHPTTPPNETIYPDACLLDAISQHLVAAPMLNERKGKDENEKRKESGRKMETKGV